jgi:alkylation response protein AidB-like acyl-CoA dehydrogenase
MDLRLSEEHLRFRDEARAWLEQNVKRPWREEVRDPKATDDGLIAIRRAWQRKLNDAGYLGLDWPKEWGGRGLGAVEKTLLEAELARADAPPIQEAEINPVIVRESGKGALAVDALVVLAEAEAQFL